MRSVKFISSFLLLLGIANAKKTCRKCDVVAVQDNIEWGFEKGNWCVVKKSCQKPAKQCFSAPNYPCCNECDVVYENEDGRWGYENKKWCGIMDSCKDIDSDFEEDIDSDIEEDDVRVVEDGVVFLDDPYLYQVGRWDHENVSQWVGTGFKLDFTGTSLTIVSGKRSQPFVTLGYSLDYQEIQFVNVTVGENKIIKDLKDEDHNINLIVSNTMGNFLQLDSIIIDAGAKIHKYQQLDKYIQVIGDSLSSGQYAPNEAADAWSFLLGQKLNVELDMAAQPGICLTEYECWGNSHGMERQYFYAESTQSKGYGYTLDEPYDFSKKRAPEFAILFIGTNDRSVNCTTIEGFYETTKSFIGKVREIYPKLPFIVTSLLYDINEWNDYQSKIPTEVENVYFSYVNDFFAEAAPYIYPSNGHFTQMANCEFMEKMSAEVEKHLGFKVQEMPTDRWGMHGTIASGYEVCSHPLDDSIEYHYPWTNEGGFVGAW